MPKTVELGGELKVTGGLTETHWDSRRHKKMPTVPCTKGRNRGV